jgi:hypothetical protein
VMTARSHWSTCSRSSGWTCSTGFPLVRLVVALMTDPRIALCGWCRTELPDSGDWTIDVFEVQHHFLIAHGQPVNNSITYVYPDQVEAEFHRFVRFAALRAAVTPEAQQ